MVSNRPAHPTYTSASAAMGVCPCSVILGWTLSLVQMFPHRSECGHHVRLCRGCQSSDSRKHLRPDLRCLRVLLFPSPAPSYKTRPCRLARTRRSSWRILFRRPAPPSQASESVLELTVHQTPEFGRSSSACDENAHPLRHVREVRAADRRPNRARAAVVEAVRGVA